MAKRKMVQNNLLIKGAVASERNHGGSPKYSVAFENVDNYSVFLGTKAQRVCKMPSFFMGNIYLFSV